MAESMSATQHGQVRFVVWWYRLVLSGFCLFAALIILGMLLDPDGTGSPIVTGCILAAVVLVLVRSLGCAAIELDEEGVRIRALMQRRRVKWHEIADVGVTAGLSAGALIRWRVPYFELSDGTIVRAEEIRSAGEPSKVDEVVDAAKLRLDRFRASARSRPSTD